MYYYKKDFWLHAWGNVLPLHWLSDNEYSYNTFIGGQWVDYSGGLIFGYWFKENNFGFITSIFLILYGIFRFLIEFLREPDAHIGLIFNSITMGQLLSVPLVIIGVGIYLKTHSK